MQGYLGQVVWSGAAVNAGGASPALEVRGFPHVSAFGSTSAATDIELQASHDGTNFFTVAKTTLAGAGDFGLTLTGGFAFVRLKSSAAATITAVIAASG